MNKAYTYVRILLGIMLLVSSVSYFLEAAGLPHLTGETKKVFVQAGGTGFINGFQKLVELLCGISFLTNYYVAFTLIFFAPFAINTLLVDVLHLKQGLPVALLMVASITFLALLHKRKYATLFNS
ncbi:MAG: hypothetical protein ACK5NT_11620 [Pyrinomonadaceae bacterium]